MSKFFSVFKNHEEESISINNSQVKAYGLFHADDNYVDEFVNGPYSKKLSLKKLGLDKVERPFSIESIDVDRDLRRKNIGTKAIKTLEHHAFLNGADCIFLNASPIGTIYKEDLLDQVISFYNSLKYVLIRKSSENAEMFKKKTV